MTTAQGGDAVSSSHPRVGRVAVRGPQVAPTVSEVLGDPRRGHVQERARSLHAAALRRRHLRLSLVGAAALVVLLGALWLIARFAAVGAVAATYPLMALLAWWALRRTARIEAS